MVKLAGNHLEVTGQVGAKVRGHLAGMGASLEGQQFVEVGQELQCLSDRNKRCQMLCHIKIFSIRAFLHYQNKDYPFFQKNLYNCMSWFNGL